MERHLPPLRMTAEARWQSGYAADCNSVYAGSIPTLASIFSSCPGGGIGRRNGLKIRYSKECAGSSPAPGTIFNRIPFRVQITLKTTTG